MTRDEIIAENPLERILEERGVKLIGSGTERKAKCPFHSDGTPSFLVNVKKQVWRCPACNIGGSVIDLLAQFEGTTPVAILRKFSGGESKPAQQWTPPKETKAEKPRPMTDDNIKAVYDYRNVKGDLVYQAVRLEYPNPEKPTGYDKSFRQRRPDGDGGWIWNMEGVERVIYQLQKVIKSPTPPWIVEGEKDADNLTHLGVVATCNVGGAGKWMEAYAEHFRDKEVVICGDNDKPGKEHADAILKSLEGKVQNVRVIKVPAPHKDITDYLDTFKTDDEKVIAIETLFNEAVKIDRGVNIEILSMEEAEQEYIKSVKVSETRSLNLANWLPSLACVRPLVGGEVMAIIAGTAVGKTALAQNLLLHAAPLKSILFEQELPTSLTFERFASQATKVSGKAIYHAYKTNNLNESHNWRKGGRLSHVYICPRSRLTPQQVEDLIIKSELKIGEPPAVAVLDYIQLSGGKGDRRERVAESAEGMKVVAKKTSTIIVILSQVSRKPRDADSGVELHDAKEAGEIENSSGLVIGAWRDEEDPTLMHLKVLKNTKGLAGKEIKCNFDGETMLITERDENAIHDEDVPETN